MNQTDIVIIGAGAAGLMCAIEAGRRRRKVIVLEHSAKAGEKIRISGGGRCNFTNINVGPENYISRNPHFCRSALARYTPNNFLRLLKKYEIKYSEKKLGQLFCSGSSDQIIRMLMEECRKSNVEIRTGVHISNIDKQAAFNLLIDNSLLKTSSLVIATGGLSIPALGATPFGFKIAKQFGINTVNPNPGLVPLKFNSKDFKAFRSLSGVSIDSEVGCNNISFRENILLTHRGLSGPAILQISSYWKPKDPISVNLLPEINILDTLKDYHQSKRQLATVLEQFLPSRFVRAWLEQRSGSKPMNHYSLSELRAITVALTNWKINPTGTEGYAKAEVTIGGIDTDELSSKTMEAKKVPGLYFIGEVVDVTGWLGGYNLQWAWSSGWAAGQAV